MSIFMVVKVLWFPESRAWSPPLTFTMRGGPLAARPSRLCGWAPLGTWRELAGHAPGMKTTERRETGCMRTRGESRRPASETPDELACRAERQLPPADRAAPRRRVDRGYAKQARCQLG